ncbi:hypothetical protein AGLY_009829 [Aphis glycines]|uniref:Reverse transcriptase domain-containing protein n=1 Tax=Aphis glycines TaxID=307491 RepID=A0A6G0TJ68_APHGL|nr:hypothetical protein AGLY_009829 [Aphis glycines]
MYKWCQQNVMHLNLKKCFYITFYLKKQPIQLNYSLGNINLLKYTILEDESALKTLFYSLIRSHFDYALLIWHPYLVTQIQDLNKIQNNFIRFLCYQCFVYRSPPSDYNVTIRFFNMQSLEQRFMQIKSKFLFKLLNNMIDCPELLQNINFKINSINHRFVNLFYIKHSTTNYMRNSPSNISMSTGNSTKNIDFFEI